MARKPRRPSQKILTNEIVDRLRSEVLTGKGYTAVRASEVLLRLFGPGSLSGRVGVAPVSFLPIACPNSSTEAVVIGPEVKLPCSSPPVPTKSKSSQAQPDFGLSTLDGGGAKPS
jgi:hypothetical protein